jgi:hypothetical protein
MTRPDVPIIGEPNWGQPLIDAVYEVSDKVDVALSNSGEGFSGGITANDIEVTDSSMGLVLKGASGEAFRITVGNDGALTTTTRIISIGLGTSSLGTSALGN